MPKVKLIHENSFVHVIKLLVFLKAFPENMALRWDFSEIVENLLDLRGNYIKTDIQSSLKKKHGRYLLDQITHFQIIRLLSIDVYCINLIKYP